MLGWCCLLVVFDAIFKAIFEQAYNLVPKDLGIGPLLLTCAILASYIISNSLAELQVYNPPHDK